MAADANQPYCAHFAAYTNSESCCTPEADAMLYVSYTAIKTCQITFRMVKKKVCLGNLKPQLHKKSL